MTSRWRPGLRYLVLAFAWIAGTLAPAAGAQFTLSWSDNSTNETGFRVERSSDAVNYTEIATVGANVVTYVDTNLPNSTTYSYRVRAFNSAGNSGYSNVATGTTPPPASNNAPTISDIANQTLAAGGNTGPLAFTVADVETAAGSLTLSAGSSNTTLVPVSAVVFGGSGSARTVTVTPAAGQTGTATITVSVSDGSLSSSDTFVVTVNATNTAPTISDITNRTINEDSSTGAIAFTVGDAQTAAGSLTLAATSSNTALVPVANVVFAGSGASRTLTVTPVANQSGTATITVTVSDGSLTASDSFVLTVNAVNDTPTISNIGDRSIAQDTNTGAISFTVSDVETAATSLTLSAASTNSVLVPVANVVFGGSGTSRTVTVTPVAGQTGTATITVSVRDGSLTASDTFVLTVTSTAVAPTISAQPVNASVIAGSSASFSITATGKPAPSYQWRFNGSAIAGATAATYAINPVQSTHAGQYSVVVSNSAGSVTSSVANLTVTDPISIIAQPASQSIARNATVTVSVTASGSGLSYQWYTGAAGDLSAPIAGATSAAYTSPKLTKNTSYWVRIAAPGQSANSAAAVITVVDTARAGSGSINKGNKILAAAPVLSAGAATDGTFAVMIGQDGMVQMLAIDAASGLVIDAGGVALSDSGAFSFEAPGVGTVNGTVAGNIISGSIAGTDLTFTGTVDRVDGPTSASTGWYNAILVNSSNDEIVVLAGPDGRAFVLAYTRGTVVGGLIPIDASGVIAVTLSDGRVINLAISPDSGRITGTTIAAGKTDKVSGLRAGEACEKRLVNTSVRAEVKQGDALMVAGFVIGGTGEKRVMIRAVGPTLGQLGVTGALADPVVTLFRYGTAASIAQNDNWGSSANAAEMVSVAASVGAFALPSGSKDAVLLVQLPAGIYTAQVTGAAGQTGAALVEVYDADAAAGSATIPTQLANISMRGHAGAGDKVVIAGFVVNGNAPKQVLIRAVGAELGQYGVTGLASDPNLTVYSRVDGKDVQIATNNDWGVDAATVSAAGDRVGAFKLASGSTSSALVIWLEPGVYTAHAGSNSGPGGVALVEVYEVQ